MGRKPKRVKKKYVFYCLPSCPSNEKTAVKFAAPDGAPVGKPSTCPKCKSLVIWDIVHGWEHDLCQGKGGDYRATLSATD